jgi:hypothetical protein
VSGLSDEKKILKLKSKGLKVFGICECGHENRLKGDEYEFNLDRGKFILLNNFRCSNCEREYEDITTPKTSKRKINRNKVIVWGSFSTIVIALLFVFGAVFSNLTEDEDPSFYKTEDPSDMTNKELDQFLEWQDEQDKKEFQNDSAFD